MGVQLNSITSKNWTISIAQQGAVLTDIECINQCILVILTTIPGTNPLNPLFGCNIYSRIDMPINQAVPLMITDIKNAIAAYEPRVTVSKITYQLVNSNGGTSVVFTIYYNSAFGNSFISTSNIPLAA